MRRGYHCGFVDQDDWLEPPSLPPYGLGTAPHNVSLTRDVDGEPYETVYCPGYLVQLPLVTEAWQAYSARKDGLFEIRFPGKEQVLIDETDACTQAVNLYEHSLIAKSKQHQGK